MLQIQPNTERSSKKRIGRGGKRGKTSGRGHKGQHQHGGHGIRPEIRDRIKKLPKLRGHGKNRARTVNSSRVKPVVVNLSVLDAVYTAGEKVTPTTLIEKGIVTERNAIKKGIKILAKGEITKKIEVSGIEVSQTSREKIEKAGGSCDL